MKTYIEPLPPINIFKYLGGIVQSGDNFKDVLLTSRGRDAIQIAVDLLNIGANNQVLLPALTCDTVSSVFSGNCQIIYYDLLDDYSIDLDMLEQMLNKHPRVKTVYVIHYFGFIHENIQQIKSLCEKNGVFLIEDHAHSALSTYDKTLADMQIYSFRKLLPTADGGGISVNRTGLQQKFHRRHQLLANQKGLLISFKRVGSLYSRKVRCVMGKLIQQDINSMKEGHTRIDPLPVSAFGRGIIRSSNIAEISSIRRDQYRTWLDLIKRTPFKPLFPELKEGIVPVGFPINIKNNEAVLEHFKRYNIFLKIHWRTLPPNMDQPCSVTRSLAANSITLPIYQGLNEENMRFIRDELLKCGVPL